jgi:predicted kinase
MRKLFFLRGLPGAGKSTWLKKMKLEDYTLSIDRFKMLIQSPILTEQGDFQIAHNHGRKEALRLLCEVLEKRMANGDLVIIDGTYLRVSDILFCKSLADNYRYQISVINFPSIPLEIVKERNRQREGYRQLPEEVIEEYYQRFQKERLPDYIPVIDYKEAEKVLYLSPEDFSHYRKIHHIGDIHGWFQVLIQYFQKGLREDELYIFTGDYIDRGIQNAEVLKFLFSIMDKPNVILLEGNHERHLWDWANNKTSNSMVFEHETKVELEKKGISRKEARRFCKKLKEFVYYQYGEKEILVTHGGLPVIPSNLLFVSSEQLIKGVGNYKTPIDDIFNQNQKQYPNRYQIHGHRNYGLLPISSNTQSFNLEGGVDIGGHLRIVTLDKNGFEAICIKNDIYQKDVG